jgi:hypothetical protein
VSPEERFEDLVDVFCREPGVTPPAEGRGFGSHALRVHGKIFTLFVRGHLVVKLPRERVDALEQSGDGVRFDANKGTPMKEWLRLDPTSRIEWEAIAREAMLFVSPN